MNLGELFVKIGVLGNTDKLDKTIAQMEKAEKRSRDLIKYRKDLAKATDENEKKLVKQNFADKIQLENLKNKKNKIEENTKAILGTIKAVGALVGAVTLAYKAMDIMVTKFAQANQQMINFQRTTGISFASLNKYASANAAVNFNSSIEGTAQTMSRLANNLWDIRMGRGDISPYQELAFVGGKAFNPMGMSVEQLIESVREAIKGVDDLQATNIIQRMGFAPDDLLMLRMSREEFEKINDLFLSAEQREAMNKYSLELKKVQLQFNLLKDKTLLKIVPVFVNITKHLQTMADAFVRILDFIQKTPVIMSAIKGLAVALGILFLALNPVVAKFSLLYLVLEDIAYWIAGKGSLLGDLVGNKGEVREKHPVANHMATGFETLNSIWDIYQKTRRGEITGEEANALAKTKLEEILKKHDAIDTNRISQAVSNMNINNQFAISTQQPIDKVASNLINTFTPAQVQFSTASA